MKKLVLPFLAFLVFTSCGETNSVKEETSMTDQTPISSIEHPDTTLLADLKYKILNEISNPTLNKSNIDIELNRKASKQELTNLAYKLRATRNFERLWIGYTLPNMKVGSGAWATSHFTPDLKVEILGSTAEEEENQNKQSSKIEGTSLGKWYEQQKTSATYVLYNKDNKLIVKMTFKDGGSMENEVTKKKAKNGERIDYKEDMHGEYFIVTKNGNFEFYNKENVKFATGTPTN